MTGHEPSTFSSRFHTCGRMLGLAVLMATAIGEPCGAEGADQMQSAAALAVGDLEGATVRAKFLTDQVVQREGGQRAGRLEESWSITIQPDRKIAWEFGATWHAGALARVGQARRSVASLDQAWETPGGHAVWQFSDGKLTFLRSHPAAAFRTAIAFSSDGRDLTCTADKSMFRERGKGHIVSNSAIDPGTMVTILSWKLISSSCRVERSAAHRD